MEGDEVNPTYSEYREYDDYIFCEHYNERLKYHTIYQNNVDNIA